MDHASSCATLTSVGTLAMEDGENSARLYANSNLRQSAMSISNSYFTAPRLSSLYGYSQFGAPHGISSLELTLGQEDFFIALEGLEPLELSSHGGPKGSEGESSSTLSTPVHNRRPGDRPPPDYLKLTYDEDSHGFSAGEDYESDFPGSATATSGVNPFVLVGWSQVEDQDAFVELLNRVRTGSTLAGVCTQAHMDLIDDRFDVVMEKKADEVDRRIKDQDRDREQDGILEKASPKDEVFSKGKDEHGKERVSAEDTYVPLFQLPQLSENSFRGSFKNPNIGAFFYALCTLLFDFQFKLY